MSRSLRPRLLSALATVMLAAGLLVGTANSAHAGKPACDLWTTFFTPNGAFYYEVPTVGYQSGNIDCVLGVGNASIAVSTLQETLNDCYSAGLATDGKFGPRTRAAVKNAQRGSGAAADGVYGPVTAQAIFHPYWTTDTSVLAGCGRPFDSVVV